MIVKKSSVPNHTALAIGLMSGTSHDGVSAAVVAIDEHRRPPARALHFKTYPYPVRFRERLLSATSDAPVGSGELSELNFELGRAFGRAAISIARAARIALDRIDLIGSHGHTFFHHPPSAAGRRDHPSTLQLGESSVIAAMTNVPVVADFRPMDIALGGEGAPLAPLAHLWLFADRRFGRIIQNIGGIGNATYIPRDAKPGNRNLIAFDTGPGVGLIDTLASRISGGRLRMDRGGKIAATGRVSDSIIAIAMRDAYFRRRPPKSTGREKFGANFLDGLVPIAKRYRLSDADFLATVTALTARSIACAVRRFIAPHGPIDQLIATGGGARNPTLVRMLVEELSGIEVMTANQAGVDGDSLEAVAFAILGYQWMRGRPGNIPRVTGASQPAILGKLTLPPSARA